MGPRGPAPHGVLAGPGTPRDPKSHLFATKWVAIPPFGTLKPGSGTEFRPGSRRGGVPGPESTLLFDPFWTQECQKVNFLAGFRIYVAGRLSKTFPRGPRGPKGPTGAPRGPWGAIFPKSAIFCGGFPFLRRTHRNGLGAGAQGAPWGPPRGPLGPPKGPKGAQGAPWAPGPPAGGCP